MGENNDGGLAEGGRVKGFRGSALVLGLKEFLCKKAQYIIKSLPPSAGRRLIVKSLESPNRTYKVIAVPIVAVLSARVEELFPRVVIAELRTRPVVVVVVEVVVVGKRA